MSGRVAVPFAILAMFVSGWSRALLLLLAGTCILFASFRVWKNQQEEIANLRIRPYDEEQPRLVKAMLAPLGSDERDVLRYLVQFGEREQQKMFADARLNENEFSRIFDQVVRTGLLNREERQKPGRAGLDLFWLVNAQFMEVLKDELFPRKEDSPKRCFPKLVS